VEDSLSVKQDTWLAEEIADFFSSGPTPEQIIGYRPSAKVQKRLRALLEKNGRDRLTEDERRELDVFEYAEALLQLVKARVRKRPVSGS
jgi:hypothetical protein